MRKGELYRRGERLAAVSYTVVKGRMGEGGMLKILEGEEIGQRGAFVLRDQEGESWRVVLRPLRMPIRPGDGVPFSLGRKLSEGGGV